MELNKLNDFVKGWIIGNFDPSLFKTDMFEISIKRYKAGDSENSHYHALATEWTAVVSGSVIMNGVTYTEDDIITVDKGEWVRFECVTDAVTVVVKIPCVKNDKYTE